MIVIDMVDGVQVAVIGREREEAGLRSRGREAQRCQGAFIGIPAKGMDSTVGAIFFFGVGGGKEQVAWLIGPGTSARSKGHRRELCQKRTAA